MGAVARGLLPHGKYFLVKFNDDYEGFRRQK